jgi:serine/threonine-protein phosphatase 2A regulatory subunit B
MFLEGTRKIVTRDLISVKIWDMCNNTQPLVTMPVDENIKSHLCDIFEADALDDRFTLSNTNGKIMTGNYSNSFHLIDSVTCENTQY